MEKKYAKIVNEAIKNLNDKDSVPYYSENVEEFDDKLYELAKQFGVEIKD